jgi:hypothetical protein
MVTSDRRNWQVRSKLKLVSFAVSPTEPELVVATTERGLDRSRDGGRRWQPIRGPAALLLDWKRPEELWAMTADGQAWRSRDAIPHERMDAPGHFMTRDYADYGATVTITPPPT